MLLTIENILSSSSSSSSRSPVQIPHPSPEIENASQGVYAAELLKMGLLSREYNSSQLMTVKRTSKLFVSIVNGFLESSTGSQWLRNIRFSENIYSQNAVFEMTSAGHIRIRTIKSIPKGEEIIAWFTDELALFMSINFLSPFNIKGLCDFMSLMKKLVNSAFCSPGNNCYTCHICGKSFQSPNPLKIHIATACERQTYDMLWMRLHYIHRKVAPSPIKHIPVRSAFEAVPIRFTARPLPPIPQAGNAFEAAAQIETLVSNMGTSKTGHLCIYCGKVYSRKYGLKIHIRTHTGFKPLKCKYCFRPFGDPSNLNKHLRLHTQNESSHKCHLCNKVVSRRRDLQRHMETKHIFHQPVHIMGGGVDDGEVINVDDDFDELSSVESD